MSSSNWLDRLWSSPIHPFIPSESRSHHAPPITIPPQQPSNPFTRITHSLSDLFCVAPYPTIPTNPPPSSSTFPTARKFPRKQPNPMHYIATKTSDSDVDGGDRIATRNNVSVSPMMTNSGLNESTVKLVENFSGAHEEEDPSLDGFSTTEVTVIDTSFAGWKFQKFLFRKDATWKARDKKGNKATVALRKKMMKNKEKKRKSLVTATENFAHKKLKVLYPGSSACNEV